MKKGTEYLKNMIGGITDDGPSTSDTLVTIDFSGGVVIDSFSKIIDYNRNSICVLARGNNIYIYGDNLRITACSKNNISLKGDISKIELG